MSSKGQEKITALTDELSKKGFLDADIQTKINELESIFLDKKCGSGNTFNQKDLICIPMNPIVKETVDLGGAEMVAGVYNVLGTAFVSTLTKDTTTLAIAGPVIEKIGFVIWEAIKAYRTHYKEGTPFSKEFKANLSNGVKNLIIDITIHDSIYTAAMAYGLSNNILNPIRLSFISFLIGLAPAIFIKYSGNELLYYLQKQYSKMQGFKRENYYEARFIVNDYRKSPEEIFELVGTEFGLGNYNFSKYNDIYYHHNIPSISSRIGTVKYREIEDLSGTGDISKGLEIAHTLPTKKTPQKESIYNYFYSSKEKGKKDLPDYMTNERLMQTRPYTKIIGGEITRLQFNREMLYDKQLRITLDQIVGSTNRSINKMIEIKVYDDVKYLMEAMYKIMSNKDIEVQITTHPKVHLLDME